MKEQTLFDESYFESSTWLDYMKLREERPEMFSQSDQLMICLDRNTVLSFMNRTGRAIGVQYKSPFSMMVVDLVMDAGKNLFAYERLLPTVPKSAVVAITKCGEKFVLIKQYRHSLRSDQIAFPRGFGETDLTALENAEKELREELGASAGNIRIIGFVEPDSGLIGSRVAVVCCSVDRTELKSGYEGIKEVLILSREELENRIKDGTISDGFTLAAYALMSVKGEDKSEE